MTSMSLQYPTTENSGGTDLWSGIVLEATALTPRTTLAGSAAGFHSRMKLAPNVRAQ
jgi:hypothetical protein